MIEGNIKEKNVDRVGSFMIWDTAGKTEFHITHAMLLGTSRGIIALVYDCDEVDH